MNVRSASITGTGAVVALSTALPLPVGYVPGNSLQAKFVQATAPTGNSSNVLFGGHEVTSSVGYPIPSPWGGQLLPIDGSDDTSYYELTNLFVYVANGDVIEFLFG